MAPPEAPDQLEEGEEFEEPDAEHTDAPEIAEEETEQVERHVSAVQPTHPPGSAPPLPQEDAPPLPDEAPPLPEEEPPDDGWAPVWDEKAQAFYFYNRFTQASQWDNPRVPEASSIPASSSLSGLGSHDRIESSTTGPPEPSSPVKRPVAGGYNPAIHGDYDPNADYALEAQASDEEENAAKLADPNNPYGAAGTFNRFTGRWQSSTLTPENFNDENKSKRQMNAFFDVDAAANSHDGKSLKAERQSKKLTKKQVKEFKEKRRAKKEEKRRAWLMD
jgi:hypothetical protein